MRHRPVVIVRERRLRATILLVVVVSLFTACEPKEEATRRAACGLGAESPHYSARASRGHGRPVIVGKVRVKCEKAPEQHDLVIVLEHSESGAWVEMSRDEDHRIPSVFKPLTSYGSFYGCRDGSWRTKAWATGRFQGRRFRAAPHISKVSPISCP
jgi:hypothetical protein